MNSREYIRNAKEAFKKANWPAHLEDSWLISRLADQLEEKDREIQQWKSMVTEEKIVNEIQKGEHDDE